MTAVKWVRMCGKVLPVLRSVAEVAHPSGSDTALRFGSGALWKWSPPEAHPSASAALFSISASLPSGNGASPLP
ncbi:MAG: hypothetical protein J5917_07275 [Bacteroidales bacterium]|nr:hypothetical protein [Bacteroidales bacterium]